MPWGAYLSAAYRVKSFDVFGISTTKTLTRLFVSVFVALEGFEPSQAEPESDVLPLHHKARCHVFFDVAKVRTFFEPTNLFLTIF